MTTVQAPQSPSAQPSFVPVLPRSSRRKLSTILVGLISRTAVTSPFNAKWILLLAAGGLCVIDGMGSCSFDALEAAPLPIHLFRVCRYSFQECIGADA